MAFVQKASATGTAASGATNGETLPGSTPTGNLVVVSIAQLFGGNPIRTISSVTDSAGNVYSPAKTGVVDGGGNSRTDTYYSVVTVSGTLAVTVTFSGLADSNVAVNEYDSSKTTLDATNGNGGSGTSITPGSVTPSAGALYIVTLTDATGGTLTPDAAWTERQETESTGTCPINVHDLTSSGAQNPTTALGASGAWCAQIISFVSAAKFITAEQGSYRLLGYGTVPDLSTRVGTLGEFDPDLRADCWFDREGLQ
jgi:hypothetical protein